MSWRSGQQDLLDQEACGRTKFTKIERFLMTVAKSHNRMQGRMPSIEDTTAPKQTQSKKSTSKTTSKTKAMAKAKAVTKKTSTTTTTTRKTTARSKPESDGAANQKQHPVKQTKTATGATKRKSDDAKTQQPSKKTKPTPAPARGNKKRKSDDEDEDNQPPVKKARPTAARPAPPKVVINQAPTQKLDVYVFGEGSSGELGLGSIGNITDVKRPRLNAKLSSTEVGVVQISVGGMHVAALTHDNKIFTWGVNDQGALGRDTIYEPKMVDAESDSEDEDTGINPRESTPTAVDMTVFPAGTVITQVAAGDSVTMALTNDGLVYGCGTFRNNEGITGFAPKIRIQRTFAPIAGLKRIVRLECGDNHVLALDQKGNVFAWGSGQQNQLGRRLIERRKNGLIPGTHFGLPAGKVKQIACGAYHSFAVDASGKVWSWGLNNYGETGIAEGAGKGDAAVLRPAVVKSLEGKKVVQLVAGAHHSMAVTEDGECLTWGRIDGCQGGHKVADLPDGNVIKDDKGNPRILIEPTPVNGVGKVTFAAAGTDNNIVISDDGKAFSWGFSGNYQTGQGHTNDVELPTHIDNTAVRGKHLHWAGCGGQFSMLANHAA